MTLLASCFYKNIYKNKIAWIYYINIYKGSCLNGNDGERNTRCPLPQEVGYTAGVLFAVLWDLRISHLQGVSIKKIYQFNGNTSHLLNVSDNWDNSSHTGTFNFNLNNTASNSNSNNTSHLSVYKVVDACFSK